ncbi:MAG TPA: MMPL family transporter [Bauldia sp.]|nr:MMPL family transporter [Bauldia sp.]
MRSIGFGLERVAWPALRAPRATAAVFAAVVALAVFGATHLAFDEDLRNTFASDSAGFRYYTSMTSQFVDPENETILLVEGDRLGEPATFQKLQDLQFELQVADGIDSVYSPFALRAPPDAIDNAPPLIADAGGGLTPDLIAQVRAHPLMGSKLLSADGKALVYYITPSEPKAPLSVSRALNAEVEKIAADVLGKDGAVTVSITGYPAIRVAIVDVLKRDQIVLNGVGAIIGLAMSLIAFRSVIGALLTAVPSIFSAGIVLGGMGLFGVKVTVMSNVIPALVMILGYADGMHLSHAWRKHRDEGKSPLEAEWLAQKEVGAACMLTALTVAAAFASLALTDIPLVRNFAWTGAVAMLVACPIMLIGHALAALAIGEHWKVNRGSALDILTKSEEPSARLGEFVVRHARGLGLISAVLLVVCGALYAMVPPEHSIREHLPKRNAANAALGRYDATFDGAFPLEAVVPRAQGVGATAPAQLTRIKAVHEALAAVPGTSAPLSLWSLVQWIGGDADDATGKKLDAILDQLSPQARTRLIGSQSGAALVSANVSEMPAHQLTPLIASAEAAVKAAGGPDTVLTGAVVVTNAEASRTIGNLNWSLATAVFGDIFLLVLAFRNIPIGIVSSLANTLPLFATGALLYLTGRGMQFTAVIALTVAFGIAVDDTIHYINRLLVLHGPEVPLRKRIVETSRDVGPVLIGTTIVILAGLSTTFASGLPTITLFGIIAGVTLVVAMTGDLIVMPALMYGYARRWFERAKVGDA